jgi:hypothetical protein
MGRIFFLVSSSLNRIEYNSNCTPAFPQVAAPPQKPCDDAYCIITIESSLRVLSDCIVYLFCCEMNGWMMRLIVGSCVAEDQYMIVLDNERCSPDLC